MLIKMKKDLQKILLKLSGEFFDFEKDLFEATLNDIVLTQKSHSLALVVGGGNRFRGRQHGFRVTPRAFLDSIGMASSLLNGLTLKALLWERGLRVHLVTPFQGVLGLEKFQEKHYEAFERRELILFAGGTGEPFFSTDMMAVLGALKLGCQLLLKGTNVDGVYTQDPNKDSDASFLKVVSLNEALAMRCGIMDLPALALLEGHALTARFFNLKNPNSITTALNGGGRYSDITMENNHA
jgi:uridylate kinase